MRKTLATGVEAAAGALDDSAERALSAAAATAQDVLQPLRQDVTDSAFLVAAALVFLGTCVVVAAVVRHP